MYILCQGNKLSMLSENVIASWTKLSELNAGKNLYYHFRIFLNAS